MASLHSNSGSPMLQKRSSRCLEPPFPVHHLYPAWIMRCPSSGSARFTFSHCGGELQQVGCASQPARVWSAWQDGWLRRCHHPGHSPVVSSFSLRLKEQTGPLLQPLASLEPSYIRLPQPSSSDSGNGPHAYLPLLFEAWRRFTRPSQRLPLAFRDKVPGSVAIGCQRSRYIKVTRSLKDINRIPPQTFRYGRFVADHLAEVFHMNIVAAPPGVMKKPLQRPT